jgi:hypothetical protein
MIGFSGRRRRIISKFFAECWADGGGANDMMLGSIPSSTIWITTRQISSYG